jgi:MFS family permease
LLQVALSVYSVKTKFSELCKHPSYIEIFTYTLWSYRYVHFDSLCKTERLATTMTRAETLNVVHCGVAFMLVYAAFFTQGFIVETVITNVASSSEGSNISKHAGYYSLSIISLVAMISNFFAVPLIQTIGPRWSMLIGSATCTAFQAGFLYLNSYYFYFSSALVGFGVAGIAGSAEMFHFSVLMTGQGNYLALNSTKQTSARNSAMLLAILQSSLIVGGIFLYFVFHSLTSTKINTSTIRLVYGAFTIVSLASNIVFALLRVPDKSKQSSVQRSKVHEEEKVALHQMFASTFRLMATKEMLLLSVTFMNSGIEQSFWAGIYSTCIAFTTKLGENANELLAFNSIAIGIGQISGWPYYSLSRQEFVHA